MNDVTSRKPIPRWLFVSWLAIALTLIVLYFVDVGGDRATSNVLMIGMFNLGWLMALVWFLLDKSRSLRLRLSVAFGLAGALALVFGIFSVRFSGALIPHFEPRFGRQSWDALDIPSGSTRAVDLDTTTPFDFAGFLGSQRNNVVTGVRLLSDLTERKPEELWRHPVGPALSGFAVVNGFAATLEQRDDQELVTLYDVDTGELIWATSIDSGEAFGNAVFGTGPRSTPLIDSGHVYAISVHGKLAALEGESGDIVWRRDLLVDFGVSRDQESSLVAYGRAGSPLVIGELLIVPAGGVPGEKLASIAALDKKSGEIRWRGGDHQISMSSPAFATLAGRDQILIVNEDWVTGHDPSDGRTLWQIELEGKSTSNANVSQAVAVPPDRVFVSKGYGTGSALYELEVDESGRLAANAVWQEARSLRTKFTNVAIKDGYVYGLSEGVLECVELETGERAWKRGRYGHGQLLLVGDVLLVLTEDGEMVYVEATPERPDNVLARFQVLEGQTWNTFAVAGDRLVVRNLREAAVYRLPLASDRL